MTSPAPREIGVLGAGAFGTAVAAILARRGHRVLLLCRTAMQAAEIGTTRRNSRFFPGVELPEGIDATSDTDRALGQDILFLAFPARVMTSYAERIGETAPPDRIVVNLVKGVHPEHFTFAGEFRAVAPQVRYAALKGPTFARPLFLGELSGMTCGAADQATLDTVTGLFAGAPVLFDTLPSADAVDVMSALKNVYAIALGLVASGGPSENTIYVAVTLVMKELGRILAGMGFGQEALLTFAGMGDTLLTGLCDTSRNRTLGLTMGKGIPVDLVRSDFLAEGVRAAEALRDHLGQVHAPILSMVADILAGKLQESAILELLVRS